MIKWIVKIIREYKELKYLAYHDSLTGLLNRNWLYKNINEINLRYVYFIDINDLHFINKQGHTFGDKHIKQVVKSIPVKENDILIRYAGDEFILFSNTLNPVITNTVYAVGYCIIADNIQEAINKADYNMIKSKATI